MCRPSGQIKRPMKQVSSEKEGLGFITLPLPFYTPSYLFPMWQCFVRPDRRSRWAQCVCFGQLWNIKVDRRQSTSEIELHNISPPNPLPCGRTVALSAVSSRIRSRSLDVSAHPQAHQAGCKQQSNNLEKKVSRMFSVSAFNVLQILNVHCAGREIYCTNKPRA